MENFSLFVIPAMLIMSLFIMLAGYVSVKLCSGKKRLQKEGFPNEYIALSERTNKKAGNYIIISLVSFQVLGIILCLILGYEITVKFFLHNIFTVSVILMCLAMAIKYIFFDKDTRRALKKIVTERGDKVVIDFNYDALRLILNWKLEFGVLLFIVYFNIFFIDNNIILYTYAGLPWYLYGMLRSLRYQVLESIRYSYRIVGIFMIVYQAVKLAMFIGYFLEQTAGDLKSIGTVNIMLAALAGIFMLWTVVRGALNLPKVAKMFPKAA